MDDTAKGEAVTRGIGNLVRLWLMLAFAFLLLRVAVDVALVGAIDLRRAALLELVLVPVGQALFVWGVGRHARRSHDARDGRDGNRVQPAR